MLQSHPSIHPNTSNHRFKFEPFLQREYGFSLNPDRPICQFYLSSNPNNSCPNGIMCPNKHVSSMYNNKIVCKHWLRGLCKKNNRCEFLHEYNLRKMPECLFYSKNGFCTQTPECLYLHIDPQSKIAECLSYNKGYCPEGPKCNKRHIRRILCPNYLSGFCPKGTDCQFSHPKWDLTTTTRLKIKSDEEFMRELQEKKQELQKLRQRQTASLLKREADDDINDNDKNQLKKQKTNP